MRQKCVTMRVHAKGSVWMRELQHCRVSIHQHTSARQHPSAPVSIRQHPSASVSFSIARGVQGLPLVLCSLSDAHTSAIRQHTLAYVSIRPYTSAYVSIRLACSVELPEHVGARRVSAYVSTRQHTSAHVSTRQHTSAHVSNK